MRYQYIKTYPDMLRYFPENFKESSIKPVLLQPWLDYTESLTDKLRNEAGDAQLDVISQNFIPVSWWDTFVLKITARSVMQREIVMSAHDNFCWYARTIIPEDTLKANDRLFDRLQQESLGAIIFGNERIKRLSMISYRIDATCIEYYWLDSIIKDDAQSLWARLSMFEIDGLSPFFLIEILLPGLLTATGNVSN